MKHVAWIFVGVIAGYLIGGISPRYALEKSYEQEQKLRDLLAQRPQKRNGAYIPLISDNLEQSNAPQKKPKKNTPPKVKKGTAPEPEKAPKNTSKKVQEERTERQEEDDQKELQVLLDTQRVRSEQSRIALIDQAGFDDEEVVIMDEIIDQLSESSNDKSLSDYMASVDETISKRN